MTTNILALVDFSTITEKVVATAGELAGHYQAKCWILHVAAPDPDFVGYDPGPQYIRDTRADTLKKEHQQLQEYKTQLQAQGIECEALLVQGPTTETILGEINKLAADLVILGRHNHSRIHKIFVGSVCQDLVEKSPVTLMLVNEGLKD